MIATTLVASRRLALREITGRPIMNATPTTASGGTSAAAMATPATLETAEEGAELLAVATVAKPPKKIKKKTPNFSYKVM